ncbi:hypothetical protein RIVM261_077000 [Rivularia sp. IAM M-261]|nr:hypothetical protein RIVM261_077000 [Rivularia sp. IAM M-261]
MVNKFVRNLAIAAGIIAAPMAVEALQPQAAHADEIRITVKRPWLITDPGHSVISWHDDNGNLKATAAMWPNGNLIISGPNDRSGHNDRRLVNRQDCGAGCAVRRARVSQNRGNWLINNIARQYGSMNYWRANWCSVFAANIWDTATAGREKLPGISPTNQGNSIMITYGNNRWFDNGNEWK